MKARLVKRSEQGAQKPVVAPQVAKPADDMRQAIAAKLAARGSQQQASYSQWRALFGQGGEK